MMVTAFQLHAYDFEFKFSVLFDWAILYIYLRIESDLIDSSLSNLKLIHISLKLNFKDTFDTN